MSDATYLIGKVYDAIKNDMVNDMLYYLNKLPLADLDAETSNQLLFNLLNVCYNYNRPNMVKPIFKSWNVIYPEQPVLVSADTDENDEEVELEYGNRPSLFASLFYTLPFASKLGLPTLIVSALGMPDYTALRVIHEFTLHADINQIEKAMNLLFQVYGELPEYTLQRALNVADNTESAYIYNYLADKLNKVSEYAPVPEYMGDYRTSKIDNLWLVSDKIEFSEKQGLVSQNQGLVSQKQGLVSEKQGLVSEKQGLPMPLALETEFIIPRDCNVDVQSTLKNFTDDEILEMMTSGLPGYFDKETVTKKRDEIKAFLRVATTQQKLDIFGQTISQEVLNSLQNDIRLFRLLGPANPFIDSDPDELKEGGCRMFTCLAFSADDDDDTQVNDWFTGSCLICHRRIRRRFHAVRRPLAGGGWAECFCQWQCVRHRVSQLEELYLADEYDLGAYAISQAMIGFIEQQMLDIGIQDRLAVTEDIQQENENLNLNDPRIQQRLTQLQENIQSFTNLISAGPTAMQGIPNISELSKANKSVDIANRIEIPKLN